MRNPAPPTAVIHAACVAAARSPCQKSKRGAVVFHPFSGFITAGGWNSRPDNLCDEVCQPRAVTARGPVVPFAQSKCSMLCVHAEARAIRWAARASERALFLDDGDHNFELHDCELVHVKVSDEGDLVASGPPSCWQCAKEIADVGLLGVWLYEATELPGGPTEPHWNFYTTPQFYLLTMKECRLDP